MAFSAFTRNIRSVQAQTIASIGSNLAHRQNMGYYLADGAYIPTSAAQKKFGAAQVPAVGDYIVLDEDGQLVIWPAAAFTAHFSAGGETVTVQNSAGTVTRAGLAVVNGVVSLAAADAIVTNGGTAVLHTNAGAVSAGNAGLNSPVTFEIANGAVTDVKASA